MAQRLVDKESSFSLMNIEGLRPLSHCGFVPLSLYSPRW